MFKLHSNYKPTGDQPKAIEYLVERIKSRREISNASRCYRFWEDLYNGKYNRASSKAYLSTCT